MRKITIFLASPSDTAGERKAVKDIVDEINRTRGDIDSVHLELLKWETSTIPAFGNDPQDVINSQIGSNYDVFIGIMWKKFGTPTPRSESGTKEEFDNAYSRYKSGEKVEIMFYFNQTSLPQDTDFYDVPLKKDR